ncbi:MAG: NAD(P)-dependent oxidoreductase [Desulfobacterales bacterium]|nr:NAD(P)-dependent oxidoreductase [Desulfobacterales bacterium]
MASFEWRVHNPGGCRRVIVTKELPGQRWQDILTAADCRVEICTAEDILPAVAIQEAMAPGCDAAIGQLTEPWDEDMFKALKAAGGAAYSNYAVGFNNVDVTGATRQGIPVGNTPGVLTETTAQMAVTLTFAAARRTGEAERFLRAGRYAGWLPSLLMGELLWRKTVGVIGAGRIGDAYARMMVEGHKMNVIYYDIYPNERLEAYVAAYGDFLQHQGQEQVTCTRAATVEELLEAADCVSIHTILDESTRHLINAERLARMKPNAVIVNTSRGPVIDEAALVAHCQRHPAFRAGLDVFENEPELAPGLDQLDNVVIVPHIASATRWTREGMATLAAANVAGLLRGYPVWNRPDILPFLEGELPTVAPSILNAAELGLAMAD